MLHGKGTRKVKNVARRAGLGRRPKSRRGEEEELSVAAEPNAVQLVALAACVAALLGFTLLVVRLQYLTPDANAWAHHAPRLSLGQAQARLRGALETAAAAVGGVPPEQPSHEPSALPVPVVPSNDQPFKDTAAWPVNEPATPLGSRPDNPPSVVQGFKLDRHMADQLDGTPSSKASPDALPAAEFKVINDWGCEWQEHPSKYLGELVDSKQDSTMSAPAARQLCIQAGPICVGITCLMPNYFETDPRSCSPRRGIPYLQPTPNGESAEVSFIKKCVGSGEAQPPEPASQNIVNSALPSTSWDLQLRLPGSRQLLAANRLVLVVIAHNKADCLRRCLDSLAAQPSIQDVRVAVSLDDPPSYPAMEDVVRSFARRMGVEIWRKREYDGGGRPPLSRNKAVSKISEHFRFALQESFERKSFEFAIFLESDLLVAPDFLWYFRASAWLLEEDPSLFCISAWNDNGFPGQVSDETKFFRTDYFPGLGWMIQNTTWTYLRNIWPRFPSTGWDHWLRHGSGLQPRECVVPEVSRTHHFDTKGTNVRAGTPFAKKLERMMFSNLCNNQLGDLSYLLNDKYEAEMLRLVQSATLRRSDQLLGLTGEKVYLVPYVRSEYKKLAGQLAISDAQPRTAHKGTIITRHPTNHARLILADRMKSAEGLLPASERVPLPFPVGAGSDEAAVAAPSMDGP
eukprot:TRINITY_DN23327_c0_g1_i2.p1 TRINITY_DN23327_c0_g1~~TRINITY_DN23327_c0_g1_i2.p1  ORF type:complete len:685 (+),score=123.34 TRINITY_DN23327_c0_g1_i2:62-2116(+)